MTGRQAIVTGGCGLLGVTFAEALLEAGATVHLIDIDEQALTTHSAQLAQTFGDRIQTHICDITDEDTVKRCIAVIAQNGAIDALINSAAVDPKFEPGENGEYRDTGRFSTYGVENWRRSLEVNLTGTFLMTRETSRIMEDQDDGKGRGSIVCISSTYGLTGPDQRIYENTDSPERFFKPVDYSTTKAGVLGFVRAVAAYYRETGIRVNALTPGGAYNGHDSAFTEAYSSRTILGRMAAPDEYKGSIVFLCSDAASYMTGANLIVDGGWTAL
ncbi:MAG: SDR family oxidoreductase [Alphaproteobacteria bacterium]|nr:SDR family oxidoreductase [Alphaproteobacteria bacterium]